VLNDLERDAAVLDTPNLPRLPSVATACGPKSPGAPVSAASRPTIFIGKYVLCVSNVRRWRDNERASPRSTTPTSRPKDWNFVRGKYRELALVAHLRFWLTFRHMARSSQEPLNAAQRPSRFAARPCKPRAAAEG
jgi:hypothetical protein